MHRSLRLVAATFVLLALAAGTALAARQPGADHGRAPLAASPAASPGGEVLETDEADEPLTAEAAQVIVDRLAEAGLTTDVATLTALAADHGVGGAVRLLGWQSQGADLAVITAMRAEGMGWGRIARDLDLRPGIGQWMRGAGGAGDEASEAAGEGQGRGRDDAPGQANRP